MHQSISEKSRFDSHPAELLLLTDFSLFPDIAKDETLMRRRNGRYQGADCGEVLDVPLTDDPHVTIRVASGQHTMPGDEWSMPSNSTGTFPSVNRRLRTRTRSSAFREDTRTVDADARNLRNAAV